MSRAARAPAIAALLLLVATGCGEPLGPGGGSEPITELPRALTASEQVLIGDANTFGFNLLADMAKRDDRPNIVLSPLSASMALGMTLNGAAGTTFEGMRSTLGFEGLSQEEINTAYAGLIDLLTTLDPAVRFDIANAVWANQGFPFHDAFFQAVKDAFNARVESADFGQAATLDAINKWASDNTDGLIPSILDQLDPSLIMVLLNAIYFEGSWTTRFDPEKTRKADFTREDGSTVQVDMMNLSDAEVGLGYGDGYQIAELPYGGQAFAMVVMVPDQGLSARDVLAGMTQEKWTEALATLHTSEPDLLGLPKFTLQYDAYLNDALKAMGMKEAFEPGADFTNMSPAGDQICIDFVRQKTFIQVDENGTKAAAVTAVGARPTSFLGLIADRPFIFAIRERLTGTILFMGLVTDPTHRDSGDDDYTSTCG